MNESDLHNSEADKEAVHKAQENPAAGWPSPGQKLQKIREEMGLSHSRVADALHLTAHYIKALENDQFDKLPGKTFVKGYFRAYARLLGADVDDVLRCYEQYVGAIEESEQSEAQVIRAKRAYDQNVRWMVCAAAIIVVVVGLSWWLAHDGDDEVVNEVSGGSAQAEIQTGEPAVTAEVRMANLDVQPVAAPAMNDDTVDIMPEVEAEPEPVALAGEPVENAEPVAVGLAPAGVGQDVATVSVPEAAAPGETGPAMPDYTVIEQEDARMVALESEGNDLLEVHFSGASWIEVDNGDNTRLYNDMLDSGDDLTIRGKAPFNILVGNANVVDMTFNSRAVDVTARMRTDNSARILLEPETR